MQTTPLPHQEEAVIQQREKYNSKNSYISMKLKAIPARHQQVSKAMMSTSPKVLEDQVYSESHGVHFHLPSTACIKHKQIRKLRQKVMVQ